MSFLGEEARRLEVRGTGPRSVQLAARWWAEASLHPH
jgi:hypothetical protein